ncbi:ABC transporter substrate-binding protein [Dickeya ananatis]|uniref:ABC transporter substrate-binding protein n=1 Tax=Dickeya ananatis TaxID=3061286 RepID=UPI001CE70123|nr:iron ABC transporter substrate-binding protein [Dickeya zeae]
MLFSIFRGIVLLGLSVISGASIAAQVTINDTAGRNVTVDVPVKRAILGFYFEDYMAVGGDKAFDHVVGISREAWRGKVPANWEMYVKHRPSLATLPDIGEVDLHNVSIEKLISLKPDVVILASWQYQALKAEVATLEQLHIPVVVVDYNAQTVALHVKSTQIFGQLTGNTERANEIAHFYQSSIETVEARIAAAHKPKPKVYFEFGNRGPSEYSFTYGQNMWGSMLDLAGGDNIAAPYVKLWGIMNPEQVLSSKPDAVFFSGREDNKVADAMLMGVGVNKADAEAKLRGFTQRAGWADFPAVKNQQVFAVYQGASRTLSDFAMVQFIAKSLYPELFKDIDPVKNYLDYYRKYLPVVPQGTFAISLAKP